LKTSPQTYKGLKKWDNPKTWSIGCEYFTEPLPGALIGIKLSHQDLENWLDWVHGIGFCGFKPHIMDEFSHIIDISAW
jgi:hypothetical protein